VLKYGDELRHRSSGGVRYGDPVTRGGELVRERGDGSLFERTRFTTTSAESVACDSGLVLEEEVAE
jgi:hypothetical protein